MFVKIKSNKNRIKAYVVTKKWFEDKKFKIPRIEGLHVTDNDYLAKFSRSILFVNAVKNDFKDRILLNCNHVIIDSSCGVFIITKDRFKKFYEKITKE